MNGSLWDRFASLWNREQIAIDLSRCAPEPARESDLAKSEELLKALLPVASVDPLPGFYARVLQCIEERAKDSIWAVFIYSPFRKRLVFASMALVILLGTAVISQESADGHLEEQSMGLQGSGAFHNHIRVTGSQSEQRDAVLVNFVAHEEPLQ